MASKYLDIEDQEFKIWQDALKKTTISKIWGELQAKETPLSEHTIGNAFRTQRCTYRTYTILAEHFGTLQPA